MSSTVREHYKNIDNLLTVIYDDVKDIWGDVIVYVYDINILDEENIDLENKVRSNVWVKFKVLTGDYKTGCHLVRITVEHENKMSSKAYIKLLESTLLDTGSRGVYYKKEKGNIRRVVKLRERCVITFSLKSFRQGLVVGTELRGNFKGLPVLYNNSITTIKTYLRDNYKVIYNGGTNVQIERKYKILEKTEQFQKQELGMCMVRIEDDSVNKRIVVPYM